MQGFKHCSTDYSQIEHNTFSSSEENGPFAYYKTG